MALTGLRKKYLRPFCLRLNVSGFTPKSGGKVRKKVGKKVEKKVKKIVGKKVEKKVEKKVGKKVEQKVEKKVGKKT